MTDKLKCIDIDTICTNLCSSKELYPYVRTFSDKNRYYFNLSSMFV